MKNLWPEKFSEPNEFSPKQLLEEQASLLSKITDGMVSADVKIIDPIRASNIFGSNPFNFELTILGPFIDNYKHTIVRISHGVPMFPVKILIENSIGKELGIQDVGVGSTTTASTSEEFEELITKVLQSARLRAIIGTIITLSR